MKLLTLIRHAKSSHDLPMVQDFDRPLNARGLRDAPLIGRHLAKEPAFHPDVLITSPALRALTTATLIQREAGLHAVTLQMEPRIYEAPLRDLLEVVHGIDPGARHAVLFGHNPGLELLANFLCGSKVINGLRTGGVVRLSLSPPTWKEADFKTAVLDDYLFPALVGGGKEPHEH